MTRNGDRETAQVECSACGREFACEGTWDVEHHDGYGTRREWFPDDEAICDDCKGEGACDTSGCKVAATTRTIEERGGSLTIVGVLCAACWAAEQAVDE